MHTLRTVLAAAAAGMLAACAGGPSSSDAGAHADITRVAGLKSQFDAQFQVTSVGPSAIDPRLLAPPTVPAGVTFDPADCAKLASAQTVPNGAKGNMAATTAEGEGNRFIAIAVETSQPMLFADPGPSCRHVGFTGGSVRGLVEVVDAPAIEGARTLGTHRVLQTAINGQPKTGELYNYVANFETFTVIVTANPLVLPDRPVALVDTKRARDLLTAAVAAVRG
jgi:hypothetical protein